MACSTIFPCQQRGVAAIEFAFIAIFMVLMLLGILVYWRAFQAHQSLTRAAGDGSRAILGLVAMGTSDPCHPTPAQATANKALIQKRVQDAVTQSLRQSAMPGTVSQNLTVSPIDWSAACPNVGGASTVKFQLTYKLPYLLETTSSLIGEPSQLSEKSTVRLTSMQ